MRIHGCTPVVAINVFPGDHDGDIDAIKEIAAEYGARAAVSTHFSDGGAGANGTRPGRRRGGRGAERVQGALPRRDVAARQDHAPSPPRSTAPTASTTRPPANQADRHLRGATASATCPVCIAKTHLSISPRPEAQGRTDRLDAAGARGAGLGRRRVRLPDLRRHAHDARPRHRHPHCSSIDIDADGNIVGLS